MDVKSLHFQSVACPRMRTLVLQTMDFQSIVVDVRSCFSWFLVSVVLGYSAFGPVTVLRNQPPRLTQPTSQARSAQGTMWVWNRYAAHVVERAGRTGDNMGIGCVKTLAGHLRQSTRLGASNATRQTLQTMPNNSGLHPQYVTFALVTTQHFERRARRFLRKHPDLRPLLHDTLDQLSQDPFAPRLKLHALGGKLIGVQAVSLTHSYRLTFALAFSEEIGLIGDGVGSISRHWRTWACQCQPPILPEPFFADRSKRKNAC